VPFIIVGRAWQEKKPLWPAIPLNDLSQVLPSGALSDVAPTILHLLGLPQPEDMFKARSLIK
jgi:bisphosphoglycerate-independent phosphoglycerate mutase (AlkP superfamily)